MWKLCLVPNSNKSTLEKKRERERQKISLYLPWRLMENCQVLGGTVKSDYKHCPGNLSWKFVEEELKKL